MKLGEIIRASKSNIEIGGWSSGRIPPSAFPIKRKFPSGRDWDWRVITFEALGRCFRLLIRLNLDKAQYSAILSLEGNSALQVICHHEFHLSHRSWHCHFIAGDVTKTHPNVLRDRERMRVFDQSPSLDGKMQFDMNRAEAFSKALRRFRIVPPAANENQAELAL